MKENIISKKNINNKIINIKIFKKNNLKECNEKINNNNNNEKEMKIGKIIFEMKNQNNKKESEKNGNGYIYKENKISNKNYINENIKKLNNGELIEENMPKNNENILKINLKNNKEREEEEINNNNEKPEDISDYINIDEQYNNIYKDLDLKITNEAIEEVEEAKEESDLRQSSLFYNNISNSKSNPKNKEYTINNIGNRKDLFKKKEVNKILINKCLTLKNKEISNKSKKINKKIIKNNSLHRNAFTPNVAIKSSDNRNLRYSHKINITSNNSIINKNKNKNSYLINNSKKNLNINSARRNKNNRILLYKSITRTNNKINRSNKNIMNNNKNSVFKKYINTNKCEKYKYSSKTIPNLKKIFYTNRVYNKIDILDEASISINYNNDQKEKIKNIKRKNKLLNKNKIFKSIKIERNKVKTFFENKNDDLFNKYKKYFYSEDKIKSFNKTNDKLNITIKIYNRFFNEEFKNKSIKIARDNYHKFSKGYYLDLN